MPVSIPLSSITDTIPPQICEEISVESWAFIARSMRDAERESWWMGFVFVFCCTLILAIPGLIIGFM